MSLARLVITAVVVEQGSAPNRRVVRVGNHPHLKTDFVVD